MKSLKIEQAGKLLPYESFERKSGWRFTARPKLNTEAIRGAQGDFVEHLSIKNDIFSKVKNQKNVLRPNSVSPTSRGGIFYCVGPCFLLQKTRQKAVEKKVQQKSRPKKSWAWSSRKFFKKTNSKFLLISGKPIGETIARGGPFVMNTKEEILNAIKDYNNGTFVK